VAEDHINDLAVELLDVARHNQAEIFDLQLQGRCACFRVCPSLKISLGQTRKSKRKLFGELRQHREVIEPFKKLSGPDPRPAR